MTGMMRVECCRQRLNTDDKYGDEADDSDDEVGAERRFADEHAVEDEVTQTQLDAAAVYSDPTNPPAVSQSVGV